MSLTTVARFRVTEAEKAELEERAKERGLDLSNYLRDVSGLAPARVASEASPEPAAATSKPAPKKKAASKKKAAAPKAEAKDRVEKPGSVALDELTLRLKNRKGLTTPVARKEAERMLGKNG